MAEAPSDLRRLGFVAAYSESIAGSTFKIADSLYRTTRAHTAPWTPGFVDAGVTKAESTVLAYSMPLLSFVQLRATQLLSMMDAKVRPVPDGGALKALGGMAHRELTQGCRPRRMVLAPAHRFQCC